jgi:SpoIID/LytB domain protein
VDSEEYLLSVVGSEMSAAAPIEALKAQAVVLQKGVRGVWVIF